MALLGKIDDQINSRINRRVELLSRMDVDEYFNSRKTRLTDPRASFVADLYRSVHSNIAALLTHISAMIAALSIILIVFDESRLTQIFVFFEIITYTFFAITCVYCLRLNGAVPLPEDIDGKSSIDDFYKNYLNKRYIYYISSMGVLLTTIVFLFTILFHVLALIFRQQP